jgi:hypothetical protein
MWQGGNREKASEQPQDWTPQLVHDLVTKADLPYQAVADAHNAALAAEREKREVLVEALGRIRQKCDGGYTVSSSVILFIMDTALAKESK